MATEVLASEFGQEILKALAANMIFSMFGQRQETPRYDVPQLYVRRPRSRILAAYLSMLWPTA